MGRFSSDFQLDRPRNRARSITRARSCRRHDRNGGAAARLPARPIARRPPPPASRPGPMSRPASAGRRPAGRRRRRRRCAPLQSLIPRGRTAWLPAGGGEGAFGGRPAAARSGGPLTRAPPCESRRGQARTVVSRCRRRLVPGGGGAALVGRRRGDCAGCRPPRTGGTDGSSVRERALPEAPCGLFCAFFLDQPAGGGVRQVCGEWRPGQPAGRGRTAWLPAGGNRSFSGLLSGWATGSESDRVRDAAGDWTRGQPDCCAARARLSS